MATVAAEASFSERDNKMIIAVLASMGASPPIDWAKVARMTGLAHAKSARDSFTSVRKKVTAFAAKYEAGEADGDANDEDELAAEAPAEKKKGGRKRKTDENGDAPTPAKKKAALKTPKAGATKGRGKKVKADEEDDEDNIIVKAPEVDFEDHSD